MPLTQILQTASGRDTADCKPMEPRMYTVVVPHEGTRFFEAHLHLAQAASMSESLYLPVMTVALETDSQKEGRVLSERLLNDKSVEDLKALCVDKIRQAAASGRLAGHSKLGTLLGVWVEWTGSVEPRAWVENLTQSRDGLVAFLEAMANKAISSGTQGTQEIWYMRLKPVERFIDTGVLSSRMEKFKPQGENEPQVRALKSFQEALGRRRSGKSDGAPWRDSYPKIEATTRSGMDAG